jgi:hypothetical protein
MDAMMMNLLPSSVGWENFTIDVPTHREAISGVLRANIW